MTRVIRYLADDLGVAPSVIVEAFRSAPAAALVIAGLCGVFVLLAAVVPA